MAQDAQTTTRNCIHPNCIVEIKANDLACIRHWKELPYTIQFGLSQARRLGHAGDFHEWKKKAIEYYERKTIVRQ